MNADELMIGDFVREIYSQKIIKVREIKQSCIYTTDNGYRYSEIEPISPTTEILEKNGFKRNKPYNYIYKDDYCEVCVSFVPKIKIDNIDLVEPTINVSIKGALFDINMTMSAIHELQQALRLCGIEKEIIL